MEEEEDPVVVPVEVTQDTAAAVVAVEEEEEEELRPIMTVGVLRAQPDLLDADQVRILVRAVVVDLVLMAVDLVVDPVVALRVDHHVAPTTEKIKCSLDQCPGLR